MPIRLIVHGGAWNIPGTQEAAHLNGVTEAIRTACPLLQAGASAIDAVEQAVRTLEADPTFDAGRGAFLNSQGEIELDAMIMDGRDLNFGSVAAVQNLLHSVSVARRLMNSPEFRMLVGRGAQAYADNNCGAASTTGWGESIMKVLLAKTVTDLEKHGHNAHDASVNGLGGVITIDHSGQYGWAYNTPKMAFAYWNEKKQTIDAAIRANEA